MLWPIVAVLCAAVFAVTNILDKYTITKLVKDPSLNVLAQFLIVLFAVSIVLIHGLQSLSTINIMLGLIAGILDSAAIFIYFNAAKLDEISRVLPMWYLDTIFIAILALFFLNEVFSISTYMGIVLMLIGVTLISIKKLERPKFSRAMALMLLASIFTAIAAVITKYLLGYADYLSVLTYVLFGYALFLLPLFYLNFEKVKLLIEKNRRGLVMLIFKEGITTFATLLYIFAASVGPVTLVNALTSTQPLFVLVFATLISAIYPKFLKEELKGSNLILKFIAVILIIVSAYLIAV
ncbi:MAG TPA: DMT family transporter [Candidatus Aquilonibacter sp.]|nr:DMT family transporter [Candidatus Aquilonibacter sp.]